MYCLICYDQKCVFDAHSHLDHCIPEQTCYAPDTLHPYYTPNTPLLPLLHPYTHTPCCSLLPSQLSYHVNYRNDTWRNDTWRNDTWRNDTWRYTARTYRTYANVQTHLLEKDCWCDARAHGLIDIHNTKSYFTRCITSSAPNSAKFRGGGGCRGPSKIRQRGGGVAIIFYFLRVKNRTF